MKKRHPSGWRFFYVAVAIGSVGVDAHIDPAVRTVFYGSPRRISWYPWGDVGIAPYARRELFRSLVGADVPVRPQKKPLFMKNYGEFATSLGRTESSALRIGFGNPVGGRRGFVAFFAGLWYDR